MDGKRYLRDLEVAMEPIGRLQEYANNAKIHTAAQVEQIKNSIQEFGFNDPIAVWTNEQGKSEIVEGHGRLQAALELGMAEVPVIHLDGLTDAQRRAYTHVHNQLTMVTGWDYETLDAEMDELDFDFSQYGFDNTGFDWDNGVDDLSDDTYEEPDKKVLVCPSCGHQDTADRFKSA